MAARREALLERFRGRARERVLALGGLLSSTTAPEPAAWQAMLGELHTLKGEARMLGLVSLARLAHAVEESVHSRGDTWPIANLAGVQHAIGVLLAMLAAALVEDDAAVAALVGTLAADASATPTPALATTTDGATPTGTTGTPASGVPPPSPLATGRKRLTDVDVDVVDALCEGLEATRSTIARARQTGLSGHDLEDVLAVVERLALDAWELRIAPIEPMLASLADHARDIARSQQRDVHVTVDAAGAALDRSVLDALAEPLLHLVRNAVDHGHRDNATSQRPEIVLSAASRGSSVLIGVADNGRGIDPAAVRATALRRGIDVDSTWADEDVLELIFRPGFSTRDTISEVSGRGVGLDVARRVVEGLGGTLSVSATPGKGTHFQVDVPVGIARERVVCVTVGQCLYGIPARIVQAVQLVAGNVVTVGAGLALRTPRGQVPMASLSQLLGAPPGAETSALLVDIHDRRWAIGVESIAGERDVLRRPADRPLLAFAGVAASGVLDDGRPVLLPTLGELLRRRSMRAGPSPSRRAHGTTTGRRHSALVVDDSPIVRELLAELLSSAGMTVTSAGDGEEALGMLDRREFDIIVTDVEMPRMDGLTLVGQVRSRGLRTPIVVVTTLGSIDDKRRAAELGADAYVVKTDFSEGELLRIVGGLLGGSVQ